ncbi:hypothetical protein CKF54_06115 [Psittacicella hinzii]|uniref:Uncharacterized protein n=1 Tax=Psittacicella hinzii TaxID=2028575 RepID=A0A3A1Y3G8_9GAMM|nr:hypothetical protein [Psittacicella hinzii]RIY31758.1 hypothetical protein CKF54_06115 [Psittacicella hinzii]
MWAKAILLAMVPAVACANPSLPLTLQPGSVNGSSFTAPGSTTIITSGFNGTTTVYTNGKNGQKVTTFAPKQNKQVPLNFIRTNNAYYQRYSYLDSIDYGYYVNYNLGNMLKYDHNNNKVSYAPYVYMGAVTGRHGIYSSDNFTTTVMGTGATYLFNGAKIGLEVSVNSNSYDPFWRRRW